MSETIGNDRKKPPPRVRFRVEDDECSYHVRELKSDDWSNWQQVEDVLLVELKEKARRAKLSLPTNETKIDDAMKSTWRTFRNKVEKYHNERNEDEKGKPKKPASFTCFVGFFMWLSTSFKENSKKNEGKLGNRFRTNFDNFEQLAQSVTRESELSDLVQKAIRTLDEKSRKVIELSFGREKKPINEIAVELKISPSTIARRKTDALKYLREFFDGQGYCTRNAQNKKNE